MKMRLSVLVTLLLLIATVGWAQTPVTATSGLSFPASANDGTNPDGTPIVGGYRVNFQPAPGCPAYITAFLGKPAPVNGVITVQPFAPFATLPPNCAYTISVTAVGQGPMSATSVLSDTFERFVTVTPPPPLVAGPQGRLVTRDDITCAKVYRTPYLGQGYSTTFYPMHQYHRADGTRWIMQMTGDGHLVDFPESVGAPCDTPMALIPQSVIGNDYGTIAGIENAANFMPGHNSEAMYAGLHVDQSVTPNRVTISIVNVYTGMVYGNGFFTFEFDPVLGTKTLKSCWGLKDRPFTLTGGGMVDIPNYFQASSLAPGVRWSVGNGGPNGGVTSGISDGMVGFANAPPPDNACAAGTDYMIGPGTTLVEHPPNNNGPNCPTPLGIGCTPTVLPTLPYPQRTKAKDYSVAVYDPTWDPGYINGQLYGFIGPISSGASWDWFKSPAREIALSTYAQVSGWINTTVAATPPPTYVNDGSFYGTGTVTLVDGYAHEGNPSTSHPYPGFTLWIMTAAPGGDDVNMRNWGCAEVEAYDVATRLMRFHWGSFCGPPMGVNPYVPLVGGTVAMGCLYAHGMPGCSNFNNHLQFIDPAQFAEVARGTRDPSDITFTDDFPLVDYMPQLGCTTCGSGGSVYTPVGAPMADGAYNEFLIPVLSPLPGIYAESKLIYVFDVKATP